MRCQYCGYEWAPRKENPRTCPKCRRYLSTTPKPRYSKKCSYCGYEWMARIEKPKACPRCKSRLDYHNVQLDGELRSLLGGKMSEE